MDKNDVLLRFIKSQDVSPMSIEELKSQLNITDSQLLKKFFKEINSLIFKLSKGKDAICIKQIKRYIEIISFLCENVKLDDEEVLINIKRLNKLKQSISSYTNLYKSYELYECVNMLDTIVLDKKVDVNDLVTLLENLINREENINIIKKFFNANKGQIVLEKDTLFDFVFKKTIDSLRTDRKNIYYYICLLKLFYNSRVSKNKNKYNSQLESLNDECDEIIMEIYLLVNDSKKTLRPEDIIDKYHMERELETPYLILPNQSTTSDFIVTIDDEGTSLRDDALSIRKDGSQYIVGIHIADGGKNIIPGSVTDLQAKNNFKCIYICKGARLLSSKTEDQLSLNQNRLRNAITLYVVMNDSGEIIDYYIKENDIIVSRNLSYFQSERIIRNPYATDLGTSLNQLYVLSQALEDREQKQKDYWIKKDIANHREASNNKSEIIVREFAVLYNSLLGNIALDRGIPYIYKYQDEEYLTELLKELSIAENEEYKKVISSIFLDSKYSSVPRRHAGLGKEKYTTSTDPLRKYPDLYSQYLLHRFYFKDLDFDFSEESFKELIDYFNQRNSELALMRSEYTKSLKLIKRN